MRTPERRTVFHNFSPDFPSIFHLKLFSLLSFDTGKSQNDNGDCVHKAICQTNHHVDEFLPLHFVFVSATFGWNSVLNSSVASVPAAHRSVVANCLFNSLFPCLICRLCIFISSSPLQEFKVKSHNDKTKVQSLPQQNISRILQCRRRTCTEQKKVTIRYMEWNRQCSQSGQKEPHKAKLFQEKQFRKKSIATLHTLLANKPASMEWGIHSSPTWMIGWPMRFNKVFVTSE